MGTRLQWFDPPLLIDTTAPSRRSHTHKNAIAMDTDCAAQSPTRPLDPCHGLTPVSPKITRYRPTWLTRMDNLQALFFLVRTHGMCAYVLTRATRSRPEVHPRDVLPHPPESG